MIPPELSLRPSATDCPVGLRPLDALTCDRSKRVTKKNGGAIFSGPYDFFVFFLPFIAFISMPWLRQRLFDDGLPYWLMLVAFVHEGCTWALFTDADRHELHKKRWQAYFLAPVGILAALVALQLGAPAAIPRILIAWNLHHLIRQNVGIYALYRSRNPAPYHPTRENWAIYLCSWGFVLAAFRKEPSPFEFMPDAFFLWSFRALCLGGLVLGVWSLFALRKHAAGNKAFWFLCASMAFYSPFLLADSESFMSGFAAALVVHYVQYIGLTTGMQINKHHEGAPGWVAARRIGAYLLVAAALIPFLRATIQFGDRQPVEIASVMLPVGMLFTVWAALTHYYLDRQIWRMSLPEVRGLALPFFKPVLGSRATGKA